MTTERDLQRAVSGQEQGLRQGTPTLARAIKFSVIGSLAGTIAMDLVMVVESLIVREPADGYLALIGSVVGGGALVGRLSGTSTNVSAPCRAVNADGDGRRGSSAISSLQEQRVCVM